MEGTLEWDMIEMKQQWSHNKPIRNSIHFQEYCSGYT